MALFVRKIDLAKWRQNQILEGEDVSADAITNCMRTRNNTLSIWHVDEESQLDEAVLAIASVFEHLDAIDIIAIAQDDIARRHLCICSSRGRTAYRAFAGRHRDIAGLSYVSLGTVAELVVDSLRNKMNRRYTKAQLERLIAEGIRDGRVNLEDLQPSLQKKFS